MSKSSNASTRSGRTTVPSGRLTESREHAAASKAADSSAKKRRAPGKAPPPRPKTSTPASSSSSALVSAAKLTEDEINTLLQLKAAKEKEANMAASAKRQAAKNSELTCVVFFHPFSMSLMIHLDKNPSATGEKRAADARRKAGKFFSCVLNEI